MNSAWPVGGGQAATGGACYHLSFRSGSRATGRVPGLLRLHHEGRRVCTIPTATPRSMSSRTTCRRGRSMIRAAYWDAADLHERVNGRLYVTADFALPRDLSAEDQIALAHDFAAELTRDESLPYTLVIHAGRDADGQEHNPHVHLMISERANDGIRRSPGAVVRASQPRGSRPGGAAKTRTLHGRAWVEHSRERWPRSRTDPRTTRPRGASGSPQLRAPGPGRRARATLGPVAAHLVSRGVPTTASRVRPRQ